jgi:hypothetical protein
MKSLSRKFTAAFLALGCLFGSAIPAQAGPGSALKLDGACSFSITSDPVYRAVAPFQSGRYSTLGRGYYKPMTMDIRGLTNHATTASGVFSLELWGMPYYGAKSGSVVFSRGGGSVAPGDVRSFWMRYETKSLGLRRFGVISIFEYTSAGWVFADDVKSTSSVKF